LGALYIVIEVTMIPRKGSKMISDYQFSMNESENIPLLYKENHHRFIVFTFILDFFLDLFQGTTGEEK
jgi:hypothetical protein